MLALELHQSKGGRAHKVSHALLTNKLCHIVAISVAFGLGNNKACANYEGRQSLHQMWVKVDGNSQQAGVLRAHAIQLRSFDNMIAKRTVGHHHTLGSPSGPRGEDNVSSILMTCLR